jgi:hypothetical protein
LPIDIRALIVVIPWREIAWGQGLLGNVNIQLNQSFEGGFRISFLCGIGNTNGHLASMKIPLAWDGI